MNNTRRKSNWWWSSNCNMDIGRERDTIEELRFHAPSSETTITIIIWSLGSSFPLLHIKNAVFIDLLWKRLHSHFFLPSNLRVNYGWMMSPFRDLEMFYSSWTCISGRGTDQQTDKKWINATLTCRRRRGKGEETRWRKNVNAPSQVFTLPEMVAVVAPPIKSTEGNKKWKKKKKNYMVRYIFQRICVTFIYWWGAEGEEEVKWFSGGILQENCTNFSSAQKSSVGK